MKVLQGSAIEVAVIIYGRALVLFNWHLPDDRQRQRPIYVANGPVATATFLLYLVTDIVKIKNKKKSRNSVLLSLQIS